MRRGKASRWVKGLLKSASNDDGRTLTTSYDLWVIDVLHDQRVVM